MYNIHSYLLGARKLYEKNNSWRSKKRLLSGDSYRPLCYCSFYDSCRNTRLFRNGLRILDTEHGPLSIQTVNELVISAQGSGVAPIIRIPNNEESLVLRALDIGADGSQVPQLIV